MVFAALAGLGTAPALLLERARPVSRLLRVSLLPVAGWGLAALLSAFAALGDLDQVWLARALMALGLLLLIPRGGGGRAEQLRLLGDLGLLLVLVAPIGSLVAATPAIAFDEFAQWLPNTRFLVEHGHYWNWPEWQGLSSKPGYPNASAVIALFASQLAGPDVEVPFKTFVVILLGAFGAALASLAATRLSPSSARVRWLGHAALLATGCLVAFLDPFIDPRIAFTAYTDTPSAIIAALAVLVAAYGVGAARRDEARAASAWFAWVGLLSLTLILLRQTNLVLIAAIDGGVGLILLATRTGTPRLWIGWALRLAGPPAAGYFVWAVHLRAAHIPADIAPRPLAEWDWSAPLTVIRALLFDRLAGNPMLGGAALTLAVLALAGVVMAWRRLSVHTDDELPPPRIVVTLTAIVGLCFVAFLAWSYMAVFSPAEVAAAASVWRYVGELGPMLVIAGICVMLGLIGGRQWGVLAGGFVAIAGACALALLPFAGRSYYRLDCRYPDVIAARNAIAALRPALAGYASLPLHPARVAVVNPTMGDWMAYVLAFDMRWPVSNQFVRFRVGSEPLAATEAWAWNEGLDALLDLTALDRAALRAEGTIPAVPLLRRPAAAGDPWPVAAATEPYPLPACRAWGR